MLSRDGQWKVKKNKKVNIVLCFNSSCVNAYVAEKAFKNIFFPPNL